MLAALALLAAGAGCADGRPREPEHYRAALLKDVPPAVAGTPSVAPAATAAPEAATPNPEAERTVAAPAPADPLDGPGPLSLADCYRSAIARNARLGLAGESWLQTVLRRDQAIAGVLPRVTVHGSYFRQDEFKAGGGGGGDLAGFGGGGSGFSVEPDRREASVQLRQPLFKGFKEFAGLRQADRLSEAAREALREEERLVFLLVAQDFFSVLLAEAQVKTREAAVGLGGERAREVQARRESGLARKTELLSVQTQLAQDEAALERARNDAAIARTRLGVVVGREVTQPLADESAERPAPEDPAPLLATATERRPDVRARAREIAAAEEAVSVQQGDLWPSADVTANWYVHRDGFSEVQQATDWDVTLGLEYPLFEGGAARARIREAQSALRQARLRHAALLRQVAGEVRETWLGLRSSARLYAQFEASARLAEENFRLSQEEYRQGLASNLEVLAAQNQLQAARLDLERQRCQRLLDEAALDAALGRIPETTWK